MHLRAHPTVLALVLLASVPASTPAGLCAQDTAQAEAAAERRSPAHTHIHHVSVTFRGTPDDRGLLPTAVAEAEIAAQHAALAARDPADVDAVRRHVRHVLHALDPSTVENGPGLGYGAIRAAERTAHYISLAAAADGATEAIDTHSTHIATAARHAMTNGQAALELAAEILEATAPAEEVSEDEESEEPEEATAEEEMAEEETEEEEETAESEETAEEEAEEPLDIAAALAELASRTTAMVEGVDADGDGRIGWQEGEGGLTQAATHLQLLRRAEGLEGS